jgi:hypothetical protein
VTRADALGTGYAVSAGAGSEGRAGVIDGTRETGGYPLGMLRSFGSVGSLLAGMEEAAASLGPAGWPSNHPQIGANLDRLWRDIEHARRAAEREPPNYFYAGVVSGACLYCHVAGP